MPQYLAIQPSGNSARLLLANDDGKSRSKKTVRVRQAAVVTASDATMLPGKIKEQVEAWGCSGVKSLVALERNQCEIRRLSVPDVDKDDLPDLVRYQAVQNFSALGQDWPLDFIDLPRKSADEPRHVLAGGIAPERLRSIEKLCEQIGCPLEGIILRPCATASLIQDVAPAGRGEGQVVVDNEDGNAELFVMVDGRPILMRSVRLSDGAAQLMPEIRRTIAAAKSEHEGLQVGRVVICGDNEADALLAEELRVAGGDLPVINVADWAGGRLHRSLPDQLPEDSGRFLPLVGMVHAETSSEDTVIDFRRPRQRPPAPDNTRMYKLGAVMACICALAAFFSIRYVLGMKDDRIVELSRSVAEQKPNVEKCQKQLDDLMEVDNWYKLSPNWVGELDYLSRLSDPDELRLDEVTFVDRAKTQRAIETKDRGSIVARGRLVKSPRLPEIHAELRGDSRHRVLKTKRDEKADDAEYPWQFNDTYYVTTGEMTVDEAAEPMDENGEPMDEAAVAETGSDDAETDSAPVGDEEAESQKDSAEESNNETEEDAEEVSEQRS